MQKRFYFLSSVIFSLMLVVSACNLSRGGSPTVPPPASSVGTSPELVSPTIEIGQTSTATTGSPVFTSYPSDPVTIVSTLQDTVYPTNSGDNNQIALYERPFQEVAYLPDADIVSAFLSDDGEWYYFSTKLAGVNQDTKTMNTPIGFEIDFNRDGRGDFLLWTIPPYSNSWTNTSVQVFTDANGDVGNRTPLRSDAPSTLKTDGYETTLFSNGSGPDPEAAWARQSPLDPSYVQIAIKKSLINHTSFLWWAWTDFDLGNPSLFDYNDFYTAQEAGSPDPTNPNYPPKAMFGMDNTCRAAYGFTPTGSEPGLCNAHPTQSQAPTVTSPAPPPPPQPGSISGVVSILDAGGHGTGTNLYPVYLFANSCTGSSISSTTPDSNGNYSFPNLAAGNYCVDLFYSGSPVQPGNPQTVGVSSGNTTTVNFDIVPPG